MNKQTRITICRAGERLYNRGYVAANDGNISTRAPHNMYYITPTGVSKGFLTPEMILLVDETGRVVEGTLRPTSELKMHLCVYKERPEVGAVVHAHPLYATLFAVADRPLTEKYLPETVLWLGEVPVAPYATPATEEVPASLLPYLSNRENRAVLLENHGALTWGVSLTEALMRMEVLEYTAQMAFLARYMPAAKELTPQRLQKIKETFKEP